MASSLLLVKCSLWCSASRYRIWRWWSQSVNQTGGIQHPWRSLPLCVSLHVFRTLCLLQQTLNRKLQTSMLSNMLFNFLDIIIWYWHHTCIFILLLLKEVALVYSMSNSHLSICLNDKEMHVSWWHTGGY